ncbi:MAG: DUF3307 domain-containing protein [Calditrichaeota bacterium]|nr:DUF3307 domain-containing protein [Calditrichota bacterium]
MFFWILLLAHVIGDFPLQIDYVYQLKRKSFWGVLPHSFICTVMNVLVLLPFLAKGQIWIAILFLLVIHTILDRSKIVISDKFAGENLLHFLLDQGLHIFSIWIVAIWLSISIDYYSFQIPGLFSNRELVISLIALIFAAFAGTPIIFYLHQFWARKKQETNASSDIQYPSFLKRLPGLFERFLATLGLIWGGFWIALTLFVFFPRIILNWRDSDRYLTIVSAAAGFFISIFCGLFVLFFTQS